MKRPKWCYRPLLALHVLRRRELSQVHPKHASCGGVKRINTTVHKHLTGTGLLREHDVGPHLNERLPEHGKGRRQLQHDTEPLHDKTEMLPHDRRHFEDFRRATHVLLSDGLHRLQRRPSLQETHETQFGRAAPTANLSMGHHDVPLKPGDVALWKLSF